MDNKSMTRSEKVLHLINRNMVGLEVGPSYQPIAPKAHGWNVEIVDHLDKNGLLSKYAEAKVDLEKIEDVDYVVRDRSLAETIGKTLHYEYVIASHVIEHVPDLIGFIKDIELVLVDGGLLSLVVPDKRFCFDVIRSTADLGEILRAHDEQRTRPSPYEVFSYYAQVMLNDGSLGWSEHNNNALNYWYDLDWAQERMRQVRDSDLYLDVHCWRFTPSLFRLIMRDLRSFGVINMVEVSFFPTNDFEFFITLKKGGRP